MTHLHVITPSLIALLLRPLCTFSFPLLRALSPSFCVSLTHRTTRRLMSGHAVSGSTWTPLTNLLNIDPSTLSAPRTLETTETDESPIKNPRLAKDVRYAASIQDAWHQELSISSLADGVETEALGRSLEYKLEEEDGKNNKILYGFIVRPNRLGKKDDSPVSTTRPKIPGVLLFHTGAGPQDMFLRWKANSLVTDVETFPEGCIVLIADLLSDSVGWGWDDDRSRYDATRRELLSIDEGTGTRRRLRGAILAAITALKGVDGVDTERIAALGWCLGGQPILELGRMGVPGVRALGTFHGVFDGVTSITPAVGVSTIQDGSSNECGPDNGDISPPPRQVLICNGVNDPFVKPADLVATQTTFQNGGWDNVEILQLDNAKHGFTNPAQDFNPNPNFGYNGDCAGKSWEAMRSMLKVALGTAN